MGKGRGDPHAGLPSGARHMVGILICAAFVGMSTWVFRLQREAIVGGWLCVPAALRRLRDGASSLRNARVPPLPLRRQAEDYGDWGTLRRALQDP
ncbi:hypothetical protein E2C01_079859 [Portunus trituberculatus]|uniref:Uncharacterized protein n=1 Tax=Portunus trituberculatus TaxID=210409 RepID=A0A5B7IKM7_PORTR|nr:hypothetical protein [Portunus trituberculatus]